MLLWSLRVNLAVMGVFLTLEITEILLVIGFFNSRTARATGCSTPAAGWGSSRQSWPGIRPLRAS
jgi:hypothetical protein